MTDLARRNLLRGRIPKAKGGEPSPIRPPWAITEQEFTDCCTRCGACTEICPEHIIKTGDGNFPEIDFTKGECTFCEACVKSCQPQALKVTAGAIPWLHYARINENCLSFNKIACARCAEECESQSIKLDYSPDGVCRPEVNSNSCSGCGACISICPVSAITIQP